MKVLLHGPLGSVALGQQGMAGQQQQHHQGHHHQDGAGAEGQYFVLKPVGQHGLPSSHQQMDMLSPASMSGLQQQNADNMVMMMAAAAAGAGDGTEHPDYGQHHQYQQQQVSFRGRLLRIRIMDVNIYFRSLFACSGAASKQTK